MGDFLQLKTIYHVVRSRENSNTEKFRSKMVIFIQNRIFTVKSKIDWKFRFFFSVMVTLKRECIKVFFILLMKTFPKKNLKDKLIGELKALFPMSRIKVSFGQKWYIFDRNVGVFQCWARMGRILGDSES